MNKYKQCLYQDWKFKSNEDLIDLDKVIQLLRIAHETGAYITIFTCSPIERYQEIQERFIKSRKIWNR